MKKLKALLVKDGKILPLELEQEDGSCYKGIREAIGNIITGLFTVESDEPDYPIWSFCDDEFLLTDEPDWNVALESGVLSWEEGQVIGGPIVIVGGDETTGEDRSLTEEEIARFYIDPNRGMLLTSRRTGKVSAVHTLCYRAPKKEAA